MNDEMKKMLERPIEELAVRTRTTGAVDFGAMAPDELELIHKKVLLNKRIAGQWPQKPVQFFEIDGSDILSAEFRPGDQVRFSKNGEVHTKKIEGFGQTGSRRKVTYEKEDGKKFSFAPAGMSVKTDIGAVVLTRVEIIRDEVDAKDEAPKGKK